MDIIWMPEALIDLSDIQEYIASDSLEGANEVTQVIMHFVVKQLEVFPRSGHVGRVNGTLELVVPRLPYFIPYRITNGHIDILRVYHTSRYWPEQF